MALSPSARFTSARLFYDRHIGYVRRCLRRLGLAEEDVHELTQQTFAVALTAGHSLPSTLPRERAWLSEIAFRLAMNFLRLHRHAREELGWDIDSFAAQAPDPETELERREVLSAALDESTVEERALLWDRFVEDATLGEMSQSLGVSRASVWTRLGRLCRRVETRAAARLEEEPAQSPSCSSMPPAIKRLSHQHAPHQHAPHQHAPRQRPPIA